MKRIILLTATVFPSIRSKGTGCSEERRNEYIDAIKFYLASTSYPIIIVDNSDYDFSNDIRKDSSRFEPLHFVGDDIGRGKGWGECQILKYALSHSVSLKNADQIIKITGRLKIRNINQILNGCNDAKSVYADSDLKFSYPHSYFFCCPISFLKNELCSRHDMMNDKGGVHFEHVFGVAIKFWRESHSFHEFKYPLNIEGHPGNSKRTYQGPTLKRKIFTYLKYICNEILNMQKTLKIR